MSEQYPIVSVLATRPWSGQRGPMVSYDVMLAGEAEAVEVTQKPSTPAPQQGDTLTGEIWVDQAGRRKFKKEYTPSAQGAPQASLNGTSAQQKEEVDWEARNRLILEEASNNAAALVVAAAVQSGQLSFDQAVERHKGYASILSSRALASSRYGTGEPEPDFKDPQPFQPSPGEPVTVAPHEPLTTPFD